MTSTLRCCICLNLTHRACGKTGFPVLISESSETLRLGYSHCEEQRTKTAASGLAAHICGHDGIGRHARFRFSCFPALGFESPCPHQTKIIRTRSSLWETGSDYLGSMSIVGVEAKNKKIASRVGAKAPARFYVWQKRILFLKLRKLRIPKQTRFKTLVLLLQPSINPFDHGTSIELRISLNQL